MQTKFLGSLAIEMQKSGFYLAGHTTDDHEKKAVKRIEDMNAKEALKTVLPTTEPIIEFCVSRDLLLKILAGWGDDDFLNVQIYGETQPIIIRGEEEFAVIMPAVRSAVDPIDIRKEAGLEIRREM